MREILEVKYKREKDDMDDFYTLSDPIVLIHKNYVTLALKPSFIPFKKFELNYESIKFD
jgi:hypothetical protein